MDRRICVKYGVKEQVMDVTYTAFEKCLKKIRENTYVLSIPQSDFDRAVIFGDPYYGMPKTITVQVDNEPIQVFGQEIVDIQMTEEDVIAFRKTISPPGLLQAAVQKLHEIHNNVKFQGGSMRDEEPEQLMTVMYLRPSDRVLELGSNFGRNSLTISSLLTNPSRQLVTLECHPAYFGRLLSNRDLNLPNCNFCAENAALSHRPLSISGWQSKPLEDGKDVPLGSVLVRTITFPELEVKYNITFDTLVADCEGALYWILMDEPHLFDNMHTVIMENDYFEQAHKEFVDKALRDAGFKRVYVRSGGWGPCEACFYETWQKIK